MKLLIVTQAVDLDDPVLGFFHRWIEEFAKRAESIEVICLREGRHTLPANVRVHSLGKVVNSKRRAVRSRIRYASRFISLVWRLRRDYDAVFVHMNPEYLVLAGPLWRLMRKRAVLWYAHGTISLRLRAAILFSSVVATASAGSVGIHTRKKRIVGHGMVVSDAYPLAPPPKDHPILLLTVGRLSPVKRVELLLEAVDLVSLRGRDVEFSVVGGRGSLDQEGYVQELRRRASVLPSSSHIRFIGPVPHKDLEKFLAHAHIFLHASATGSFDKSCLESLAAGVPVVTTNIELASTGVSAIIYAHSSAEDIARAIEQCIDGRLWSNAQVRASAHAFVERQHNLTHLVQRVCAVLEEK